MNYIFFFFILLWYTGVFAASCGGDSRGMQKLEDDSIEESLYNTITISGIVVEPEVDYQNSGACKTGLNGLVPECFPIYVLSKDRTQEGNYGKVTALRDLKVDYEKKSAMSDAIDPSWIIYPENINLQAGDSLYIRNYSAVYYYVVGEQKLCDRPPQMYATGEYFVNPTEDILSTPWSRVLKVEKPKVHNRDAGGRCLNDKKRNVIKY